MENNTIFGKIIRGEIPATKVYEDEKCLAFLNINPVTKGHTLLIPKEQYTWMYDVPDELLGYVFSKAKLIMKAMIADIPCDLVQIGVVGEEVPHFHIHLIPRMHDHDFGDIHQKAHYESDQEKEKIAKKISENIGK